MANTDRFVNFSPGPSQLPVEVLQTIQQNLLNCNNSGMSAMEMSHRGKDFQQIFDQTITDVSELLQLPADRYSLLFTQGGASLQFSSVPLNLLQELHAKADYAISGQWSAKASEEASKYATVSEVFNTKDSKYRCIPPVQTWKLTPDAKYFHYCSNETVNGVEFPSTPLPMYNSKVLLVSDMSSNFLTRPIDRLEDHAVIYAGAQKNLGPAGVTVVLVRNDVIGKALKYCPTLMNYSCLKDSNSLYNTPPTWAIYVTGLVAKYLKERGGLQWWNEYTSMKAKLIYDAIEQSDGFYVNLVSSDSRSRTNIPFQIYGGDSSLEKKFLGVAAARCNIVGLEGHRLVGGLRASLYNGMSLASAEKLASFMREFESENRL